MKRMTPEQIIDLVRHEVEDAVHGALLSVLDVSENDDYLRDAIYYEATKWGKTVSTRWSNSLKNGTALQISKDGKEERTL